MIKAKRYSCAAVAHLIGVSPSYFSTNWPQWVAEGKLPKPAMLNPARPKFPAAEIDRMVAADKWLNELNPARPCPVDVAGDAELARRAMAIAGNP